MALRLVGISSRAEGGWVVGGGGISLGGACADLLAKNCARIETWPSLSQEMACLRLKISSGAMAGRLVGLRQREEVGAISWAALALIC